MSDKNERILDNSIEICNDEAAVSGEEPCVRCDSPRPQSPTPQKDSSKRQEQTHQDIQTELRPDLKKPHFSLGSLPNQPKTSFRSLRSESVAENNFRPSISPSSSKRFLGSKQQSSRPSLSFDSTKASIRSLKQMTAKRLSARTSATTVTNGNIDDSTSSDAVRHRSTLSFSHESLAHDRTEKINDDISIGGFVPIDLSKYAEGSAPLTHLSMPTEPDPSVDFGASFCAVDGSTSMYFGEPSSAFVVHAQNGGNGNKRASYKTKRQRPAQQLRNWWHEGANALQRFRDVSGALVNNERVQIVMIGLIVINAIMMGVATFGFVQDNNMVSYAFQVADDVFLSVFTLELAMQLAFHGVHLFLDAWLLFDFCIIVLSWALDSFQIIRAFRIFRALRLVTRLTVLRNLLTALFAVAPSMGGIVALLVLIMYIYAVMCTVLFKTLFTEGLTDEDYFSTLFASLFTLFQCITLDNWAYIARQVGDAYPWSWAIFSSYLLITSFILYSLIIAVVCDAVKVTEHQDEKDEQKREEGELHDRVLHLEHHIADMAEQQFLVVENLHLAMQALGQLEEDESEFSELSVCDEIEVLSVDDEVEFDATGRSPKKTRAAILMPKLKPSLSSRFIGETSFERPIMNGRHASLSDLPPAPISLLMETEQPLGTVRERASLSDASLNELRPVNAQEVDNDAINSLREGPCSVAGDSLSLSNS
ncbi:hypothetical protein MPSEU_000142300 [Mayamaea pseudoterrestris]|nr:hypothetical protein MPSEU_000142300 [Mayamaea pseudoterrestris]